MSFIRNGNQTIWLSDADHLQLLRDEFEAECDCAWGRSDRSEEAKNQVEGIAGFPLEADLTHYSMVGTARRYIIARDFNEFDPKRAEMLWKLQNGGAL